MAAANEAERVRALVARYALPESAGEQLSTLLGLLADDPLAPTAIRHRDRVLDDHLADSLVALEVPSVRDARVVVDLGSGAGIPALPLAIALPEARVTVVERVRVEELDAHAGERLRAMLERYGPVIERERSRLRTEAGEDDGGRG